MGDVIVKLRSLQGGLSPLRPILCWLDSDHTVFLDGWPIGLSDLLPGKRDNGGEDDHDDRPTRSDCGSPPFKIFIGSFPLLPQPPPPLGQPN